MLLDSRRFISSKLIKDQNLKISKRNLNEIFLRSCRRWISYIRRGFLEDLSKIFMWDLMKFGSWAFKKWNFYLYWKVFLKIFLLKVHIKLLMANIFTKFNGRTEYLKCFTMDSVEDAIFCEKDRTEFKKIWGCYFKWKLKTQTWVGCKKTLFLCITYNFFFKLVLSRYENRWLDFICSSAIHFSFQNFFYDFFKLDSGWPNLASNFFGLYLFIFFIWLKKFNCDFFLLILDFLNKNKFTLN